jgi:hypothetical protein
MARPPGRLYPVESFARQAEQARAKRVARRWRHLLATRAPVEIGCCGIFHPVEQPCPTCGRGILPPKEEPA